MAITLSCQKEEELIPKINTLDESNEGMTRLGQKLENPYSVANMKKASESLKTSGVKGRSSGEELEIITTHLYIKFIPTSEEELDILASDSTLILYDHPLDYEIDQAGNFYHDPDVPLDQITPQYCAVKVDYTFPSGVEYEVLEELFIPDENKDNTSGRQANNVWVDDLVTESLRLTHNLENSNEKTAANSRSSSWWGPSLWRPAGVIEAWDDNIGTTITSRRVFSHREYYDCGDGEGGSPIRRIRRFESSEGRCSRGAVYRTESETIGGSYVGLEGVEVRARRWFTTHEGITNATGNYSCDGKFRRPANYKIVWERYNFKIRRDAVNGAKHDGPKKRGDWNEKIKGGRQEHYATIFRAAHHYYYKNIKGLRRPPKNGTFRTQMKLRAYLQNLYNGNKLGRHKEERRFLGLGSQIKIYTYTRPSVDTYSTVIHELAHASHWDMKRSDFDDSDSKVKESWAAGVEWELTRIVYTDYDRPYFGNYTGVVIDMIDSHPDIDPNTGRPENINSGSEVLSKDNVTGYTIRQLEDALQGKRSWNSWRDNIKNKYENGTEHNLDALFNYWN